MKTACLLLHQPATAPLPVSATRHSLSGVRVSLQTTGIDTVTLDHRLVVMPVTCLQAASLPAWQSGCTAVLFRSGHIDLTASLFNHLQQQTRSFGTRQLQTYGT
jgi:hypothetical protein